MIDKPDKILHSIPMLISYTDSAKAVNTPVVLEMRKDGTVTWREKKKR